MSRRDPSPACASILCSFCGAAALACASLRGLATLGAFLDAGFVSVELLGAGREGLGPVFGLEIRAALLLRGGMIGTLAKACW